MEPVAKDPARIPIIHSARCLDCNYLLTNLREPRCPECGRGFDPHRRETYARRAFPSWARLFCKPPGFLLLLLPVFPLGGSIWELRRPGGGFGATAGGFVLFVLIGILFALRLALFLGLLHCYGRPASERGRGMLRWFVPPPAFLLWLIVAVGLGDQIKTTTFNMCERRLKAIAMQPVLPTSPIWAGILHVQRADRYQGGVMLLTGSGYDGCAYGYAYFPNGKPANGDQLTFYFVKDSWWTYWDGALPRYATVGAPPPWIPSTQPTTAP